MQYVLTGFTHDMGFRVFAFEGVGEDRSRTEYSVKADLGLIRKYRIRVQELPLLCRGLLERRDEAADSRSFVYTESDMSGHASTCAARESAAKDRKAPRKPPSANVGAAWRGTHV